jgi:AmiR/NasT family two-component response regulator
MSATHQTSSEPKLELVEALHRENEQLRTALVTRIVIEQAKGLLAERLQTNVDDAFERLRREARNRRMKLHALAAAVVACEPWTKTIFPSDAEGNAR